MSELYGVPSGVQAVIADEHTQATTRYNNSLVNKMDTEAAQLQKMQQLMQQAGMGTSQVGTVQDPAARLMQLSTLSLQSGNVKQGMELADKASQISLRRTSETKNIAAAHKAEYDQNMNMVKLAQQLIQSSTDQTTWDRGNAAFSLLTGAPSPFAGMPFSEQLKTTLNDGFTTTATKLTDEYRRGETERKTAADKARIEARGYGLSLRAQSLGLAQQREARLAKAAGKNKDKPAGMPSKREVQDADNLLDGYGLSESDRASFAEDVAQEAKRLWKNNPALTPREAAARVIMQKQANGELVPGETQSAISKLFNDKSGKVFSPLRPAPPPKTAAEAVKGQYYQTPRGLAKWDGAKFIPAKLPSMRQPAIADGEDDEDEDE